MTLVMIVVAGVLCACGTYLLLSRQLSRIVIGIGMLGHGVNILLVKSGGDGGSPVFVGDDTEPFADPLPQALVLTAIVITFGIIAFLLSMAYRSWQVTGNDEVEDDLEDRMVAARVANPVEPEDLPAEQFDASHDGTSP